MLTRDLFADIAVANLLVVSEYGLVHKNVNQCQTNRPKFTC